MGTRKIIIKPDNVGRHLFISTYDFNPSYAYTLGGF